MPAKSADADDDLTPIGRLIEDARKGVGMSQRQAAAFIGITGRGWGYLVKGRKSQGDLGVVPISGRAETLARMANVVGLEPGRVEKIRADVAAIMRRQWVNPESSRVGYDRETVLNLLNAIRASCDPGVLQSALQELGLAPPGWPTASGSNARP